MSLLGWRTYHNNQVEGDIVVRKLLIALLFVNIVCLYAICQPLAVLAGSGSGGGSDPCSADPTKYALDTNGDEVVDLSDFVAGLSWFFSGGEAPRVCLDTTDLEASLAQAEAAQATAEAALETANGQVTTLTGERDAAQTAQTTAEGERDAAQAAQATAEAALEAANAEWTACSDVLNDTLADLATCQDDLAGAGGGSGLDFMNVVNLSNSFVSDDEWIDYAGYLVDVLVASWSGDCTSPWGEITEEWGIVPAAASDDTGLLDFSDLLFIQEARYSWLPIMFSPLGGGLVLARDIRDLVILIERADWEANIADAAWRCGLR